MTQFTPGACHRALRESNRNAEQAAGWLFEHDGAINEDREPAPPPPPSPQHRVTALDWMDGEGGGGGRSGSGGMSVLDWMDGGTSWFAMPAPSGGTGFRGQGAAAPPVATPVEQQFQTLAVTRPMTGTSVMPGQQISSTRNRLRPQFRTSSPA